MGTFYLVKIYITLTVFFTEVLPLKDVLRLEPNLTVPGLRANRV